MLSSGNKVSLSTLCRWFNVARSTAYYQPRKQTRHTKVDEVAAKKIRSIIDENPRAGVRTVHSVLRSVHGIKINHKKVHRIMKIKGWTRKVKNCA